MYSSNMVLGKDEYLYSYADEETWEYFCHKWTTYKAQANLTIATKSHLEACLGDEVTQVLFGRLGQDGWNTLTETTLLESVKDIFVKKHGTKLGFMLVICESKRGPKLHFISI